MSDDPENTAQIGRDEKGRFGPGNPGKPKGSRHKLGESFVAALQADFEENGKAVIETVRIEKPADYLKVIASLLPKQVEIKETAFDGLGDDDLAALIVAAKSALGICENGRDGTGDTAGAQSSQSVQTLQ